LPSSHGRTYTSFSRLCCSHVTSFSSFLCSHKLIFMANRNNQVVEPTLQ
jgi:hypothetical protein